MRLAHSGSSAPRAHSPASRFDVTLPTVNVCSVHGLQGGQLRFADLALGDDHQVDVDGVELEEDEDVIRSATHNQQ